MSRKSTGDSSRPVGLDYVEGMRDAVVLIQSMYLLCEEDREAISEHLLSVADTIEGGLDGGVMPCEPPDTQNNHNRPVTE